MTTPRACLLAIGDELLHGKVVDTNSAKIARALETLGVQVIGIAAVGDDVADGVAALRRAAASAEVVVMTGGLGPTGDDRTRLVAARAAGVELRFVPESWQQIEAWFGRLGREPSPSNRQQAECPVGAEPLENRCGTAPGFALRCGQALCFALPGVPAEMEAMLADHVLPRLRQELRLGSVVIHELHLAGSSEARIGEKIADLLAAGHRPQVGINAHAGSYTIRIVGEGADAAAIAAEVERVAAVVRDRLREWIVYEGPESPAALVARECIEGGITLAIAESCTGGLLCARLTEVPGISAVLLAGYVTYSNAAKQDVLGVPAALLAAHGAVSPEVAGAMAEGARRRAGAALGVGITGIAGPGGGSAEKPVGLVCFGLAFAGQVTTWSLRVADLGRSFIRERAIHEALFAIHRRIGGLPKKR